MCYLSAHLSLPLSSYPFSPSFPPSLPSFLPVFLLDLIRSVSLSLPRFPFQSHSSPFCHSPPFCTNTRTLLRRQRARGRARRKPSCERPGLAPAIRSLLTMKEKDWAKVNGSADRLRTVYKECGKAHALIVKYKNKQVGVESRTMAARHNTPRAQGNNLAKAAAGVQCTAAFMRAVVDASSPFGCSLSVQRARRGLQQRR
jgi:hypothetical protein